MKILLIMCRQTQMTSYHLPVGIGYISACLKQAGHDVRIANPNHSLRELTAFLSDEITAFMPDIVGVGGMAFHFNQIRGMVELARTIVPGAIIIAGGPLITSQPSTILKGIPAIDFGVIGEGEFTMVELVASIQNLGDYSTVNGIVYRDLADPSIVHATPMRQVPDDLDSIPPCDYDGLGLDIYSAIHLPGRCAPALVKSYASRVMPLLTSRGCPYSCTFCCHEAAGRRYRLRSLDLVFSDIENAVSKWGINSLFIYDDLFCLNRERLDNFCKRIAPMNLRWECSMTAGQISPEVLQMMHDSGCCSVSIGVESMSQRVLTSMQKRATKAQLEQVLPMVYSAKMGLWSNLIFGDPAETLETVTESLEWFSNNPEYDFRFAWIGYHPGSRIYNEAVRKGLIGDAIDYLSTKSYEINGTAMSDEDFLTAHLLANRMLVSFGHAGKFLELFTDEAGNNSAKCLCPYCGTEGISHKVDSMHINLAKINCPDCNRAYRVPIFVRYPTPPELPPLINEVRAELKNNPPVSRVKQMAQELIMADPCFAFAYKLLIKCADIENDKITAARILEQLICYDPYNPEHFESMAQRLEELNLSARSKKYAKKAQHLRSIGVGNTQILELTMAEDQVAAMVDRERNFVLAMLPMASFLIGGIVQQDDKNSQD